MLFWSNVSLSILTHGGQNWDWFHSLSSVLTSVCFGFDGVIVNNRQEPTLFLSSQEFLK